MSGLDDAERNCWDEVRMNTFGWFCKRCGVSGSVSVEPVDGVSIDDCMAMALHKAHHGASPECLPIDGLIVKVPVHRQEMFGKLAGWTE